MKYLDHSWIFRDFSESYIFFFNISTGTQCMRARSVGILGQLLERDQDRGESERGKDARGKGRGERRNRPNLLSRRQFKSESARAPSISPSLSLRTILRYLSHIDERRRGEEKRAFKRIFPCLSARAAHRECPVSHTHTIQGNLDMLY